jgi:WD40 repeat protein
LVHGSTLYSGSADGTIKVWQVETPVLSGGGSSNNRKNGGSGGNAVRPASAGSFNGSSGSTVTGLFEEVLTIPDAGNGGIYSMVVEGGMLYVGCEGIIVYDTSTYAVVTSMKPTHRSPIYSLVIYDKLLYYGASNNYIKLLDVKSLHKVDEVSGHTAHVRQLVVCEGILYSCSDDCSIQIRIC